MNKPQETNAPCAEKSPLKKTDSRPIGVFDSGVGGLTVMRAVSELLPDEDIIYLGDTARVPYGNRAAETVRRYALNATDLLAERGVKAIVIACNTATSYALDAVRAHHDAPVFGVIEPAARRAVGATKSGHIAVIGTRGTVRSGCYPAEIAQIGKDLVVHQKACPLFVPLAEEGWTEGGVPREVAKKYLEEFAGAEVDTMILGCTHYPLLRTVIAQALADAGAGPITLVDSAETTAHELRAHLREQGLLHPERADKDASARRLHFLLTDFPDGFQVTAERFFGGPIGSFEHVDIPVGADPKP
ncbi:glutamate racemase [Bradymonas sediminis]|uniref:Glutamate racemase n=1 Tax=Bradymonas sediminis TaxID=1548548 RepID=A0A2Z4FQM8_9DELT|nr:glutamate racemase [Bradymonas sediminis]AWV91105.1 glutamate racemase [Bradymonas sediminis]